ncbi:MAG: HAD family hydrolase [Cytophagales bacterium]|nr:HAD family hydrolase [Cytophagales bacterium]
MAHQTHPAVFLDKDGTLIEHVPANVDATRICLAEGAGEALRRLAARGFRLVVVSNQAEVAHGLLTEDALVVAERRLRQLLRREGVELDGFYYCPYHPEGTVPAYTRHSDCRKPEPGMLLQAARDLNIDLSRSWMIGDALDDVEAGNRAGCRTVLLDVGNETERLPTPMRTPDFIAKTLVEAEMLIAEKEQMALV